MAAKAKKAATPVSESDSSSRSSTPEAVQKKAKDSASSQSEEDSDNDSSSSKSSASADSSDSESETSPDETTAKKPAAPVAFGAPKPYKAPSGFKPVKKQSPPSANVCSLLANLNGKQVYHITAPASLPLDTVKEISLGKVMQGEPILKHKGAQYGIPVDSMGQDDTDKTLLLYDPKTQTYNSSAVHNIQSYHIQHMVKLPERSETDDKVLEAAKKLVKPPRKQPKNLKMRFRPVGSGPAAPETLGSGSESEGDEPTFKVPKGAEKEREERKRKHHHTESENQPAATPRKKSKKHSEGGEEADGKEKKKSSKSKEEKKRKKEKSKA